MHLENDVLAPGGGDRWYTNGIRLSWGYDQAPDSIPGRALLGLLDRIAPLEGTASGREGDSPNRQITYSLGHLMYTPQDITKGEPQPFDRPWGALLYVSMTAHHFIKRSFVANELKLGLAGRHALGEPLQRAVHRVTQSAPPQGWNQQVRSVAAIQASHSRIDRWGDSKTSDYVGFQTGWGLTLGTIRSQAQASFAVTFGQLEGRNAPMSIANEGDFIVHDFANRRQFDAPFAFAAIGLTAVAYDYFLQGPTPYGRSQIDPRPVVGTLQWGASLPVHRWIAGAPRVVYSQTLRSPEFKSRARTTGQPKVVYGGLTLVWDLEPSTRR